MSMTENTLVISCGTDEVLCQLTLICRLEGTYFHNLLSIGAKRRKRKNNLNNDVKKMKVKIRFSENNLETR